MLLRIIEELALVDKIGTGITDRSNTGTGAADVGYKPFEAAIFNSR
jgi:hypothetical protein